MLMKERLLASIQNIQQSLEEIKTILSGRTESAPQPKPQSQQEVSQDSNTEYISEKQYKFLRYLLHSKSISPSEIMKRENVNNLAHINRRKFSDLVEWLQDSSQ
jgi:hypothetical protein